MSERKIAFYDIDKTSYQGFLAIDLVTYQYQNGLLPQQNFDKIIQDLKLYQSGQMPYEKIAEQVLIHWAEGLQGQVVDNLLSHTKAFFQTEGRKFFSFLQPSIDFLRPSHDTYFISAEPQFVAQIVKRIYRATGYISSVFEVKERLFTGRVTLSLALRESKKDAIVDLLTMHGRENSIAFGDSEADKEMLASVEHAICINPSKGLRRIAEQKEWYIVQPDEVLEILEKIY